MLPIRAPVNHLPVADPGAHSGQNRTGPESALGHVSAAQKAGSGGELSSVVGGLGTVAGYRPLPKAGVGGAQGAGLVERRAGGFIGGDCPLRAWCGESEADECLCNVLVLVLGGLGTASAAGSGAGGSGGGTRGGDDAVA
jgi:hypothetical protein